VHNTPTEKQSPEVAFGNTSFLIATPIYLFDFINYYFFFDISVAKLKRHPLAPENMPTC